MSALTNTNISNTYVGVLHANGVALPSSGVVETVYDGAGTASALQVGKNGVTCTGVLSSKSISLSGSNIIDLIYPIGSVIFSTNSTNPGVRFQGTSWMQVSKGRYLTGEGTTQNNTSTTTFVLSNNSGSFTATITAAPHYHGVGQYTNSVDDNARFIYGSWSDGSAYGVRALFGGADTFGGITISQGDGNGIRTTNVSSGYGSYTIPVQPPSFAMYVWERTA